MTSAIKLERDRIRAVLLKMEQEGRLTPDLVIDEARNEASPLHNQFTWDVQEAALKTWRMEARTLISSFTVIYQVRDSEYRVQEFVESPGKHPREQGYQSISAIHDDKVLKRQFIAAELKSAAGHVLRAKEFAIVLGIDKRVREVEKDLAELRREVEGPPPM